MHRIIFLEKNLSIFSCFNLFFGSSCLFVVFILHICLLCSCSTSNNNKYQQRTKKNTHIFCNGVSCKTKSTIHPYIPCVQKHQNQQSMCMSTIYLACNFPSFRTFFELTNSFARVLSHSTSLLPYLFTSNPPLPSTLFHSFIFSHGEF